MNESLSTTEKLQRLRTVIEKIPESLQKSNRRQLRLQFIDNMLNRIQERNWLWRQEIYVNKRPLSNSLKDIAKL